MWLVLLLLTGAEFFVAAESSDEEIKDGELSRKILGQSVVTSVSVVMDIGNGTKTIFTDTLGKPVEKPSSSSDLASPINLLNPDRYEFYTFDDNGNLVRRLMSLEEIKGIIATGDSDGLEYDSVLSESYIPEKRVNDVLSNVQNVLKEEMEIHGTKLDEFPALDTPDVSDSWNMILPAVFGNSGADIRTPEKPPLHITPDTIMIEPTEKSQSTPRSTPISSTTAKENIVYEKVTSVSSSTFTEKRVTTTTDKPTPIINKFNSTSPYKVTALPDLIQPTILNQNTILNTESKEDKITLEQTTEITTREYIPVSTIPPQKASTTIATTTKNINTETTKIDQTPSTETVTETMTTTKQPSYTTVTVPILKLNSTTETSTTPEVTQTTNLPESTIQSVETSVNCTSVKNDTESTTTVNPSLDGVNSIDEIAAPEILNQLLSTPLVTDISAGMITDTVNQLLNDNIDTTQINKEETTLSSPESVTKRNENDTITTNDYTSTIVINNRYKNTEDDSSTLLTTPVTDSTLVTFFYIENSTKVSTELSTDKDLTLQLVKENITIQSQQVPVDKPVKSTKIEDIKDKLEDVELMKTTPESDSLNVTTMVPTTLIDSSTMISNNANETTIRVSLIDPSESSTTINPSVGAFINETYKNENQNSSYGESTEYPITTNSIKHNETSEVKKPLSNNQDDTNKEHTITKPLSNTTDDTKKEYTIIKPLSNNTDVPQKEHTITKPLSNNTDDIKKDYTIIKPLSNNTNDTKKEHTITKPLSNNTDDTKKEQITTHPLSNNTDDTTKKEHTITKPLSNNTDDTKKEHNWTLVPTIAPHSVSSLGTLPPSSESFPEFIDPPVPINLKAEPLSGFSLEESTSSLDKDIYQFSQLYNELAFEFWKTTTSSVSHARSLVLSPFGTVSLLAMIFLGARGSTSAEMNEILKLDDMITFNPHLILKNVGDSISSNEKNSGIINSAFIRELFMCRMKGKLLPFYKERVRAFYDGYAEEVNFAEIADIIRRRTNLQVKKHSAGKVPEFLTDMSVIARPPLVGVGVNIFQTDCSGTSSEGRNGEMHFTVLPTIRQRRLVPIPAVLYRTGFLAGYEPSLDATAVAIGGKDQVTSTILVMPGQQGNPAPGDGLARLEKSLVESSFKKGAWSRLLRSLIPRSELEVQIPKIMHRSMVNTTDALKKMGFIELFKKGQADLVGMNGISNDLFLSDILQINQFTICGERRTEHHSELYPNNIGRNQRYFNSDVNDDLGLTSFGDPLHDLSYLDLPLPLRPRQARKPDTPRLKFDRPFLYFVRHNPTGIILHIGRFNPRLLP